MARVRRLAVVLLAAALGGCALSYTRVGADVPDGSDLEVGWTTREQALTQLGPPRIVQRQYDGELYVWRHVRGQSRSITILPIFVRAFHWEDSRLLRDDLALFFGPDGVLRAVGQRSETDAYE